MSDERLRDLERRWRETGSVDDEAAILVERVRVGQLSPDRVKGVAMMGYPAAMIAIGVDQAWLAEQSLLKMIDQLGLVSLNRALLIVLGRLYQELQLTTTPAVIASLIEAARAWLASPSETRAERAGQEGELCMAQAIQLFEMGSTRTDGVRYPTAALFELGAILGRTIRDGEDREEDLFLFLRLSREHHPCLHDAPVRATLCEKLVPWILGYSDPLNIGSS